MSVGHEGAHSHQHDVDHVTASKSARNAGRGAPQGENKGAVKEALRESQNIVFRKSIFAELGKLVFLIASVILVDMLAYSFPSTVLRYSMGYSFGVEIGLLLPILLAIPLGISLVMVWSLFDERYIIGIDSAQRVSGLLSPGTKKTEIYYRNIRAIEIDKGLIQRMLGLGDLRIGAMFSEEGDIIFAGIKRPEQYKAMIQRRMNALGL